MPEQQDVRSPHPSFPLLGFLGMQQNAASPGAYSTELNVTIPHPTEPGRWTNVPLLVPGQQGTEALTAGQDMPTREQYQRANDFAKWLVKQGTTLPSFENPDDAVAGALRRHDHLAKLIHHAFGVGGK